MITIIPLLHKLFSITFSLTISFYLCRKMPTSNLKEQRKFMAEFRARCVVTQSTLKFDSFGLRTWPTRKKKPDADKETQATLVTHTDILDLIAQPPYPTKTQKTMMADPVNSVDHVISTLMQDPS